MVKKLLALGGDGIGPEVLESGLKILETVSKGIKVNFDIDFDLIGGICWDKYGTFCRNITIQKAKEVDAILVGAVGGPKWDAMKIKGDPVDQDGLMCLRKKLNTFFGIRPIKYYKSLHKIIPFNRKNVQNSEIIILREMCGGVMFSKPRGIKYIKNQRYGFDTAGYYELEIKKFAECGFELAKKYNKKIISIDKSNVMESYRLWRDVVQQVSHNYPNTNLEHLYADNCAFQMIMNPKKFDVILSCNFLGDIFSDLAATISGSIGMLPSASLCGSPLNLTKGIYEPVHGTAPELVGTGAANPIGMILSISMMLKYSFGLDIVSKKIEFAIDKTLQKGCHTRDLKGNSSTIEMTNHIIKELKLCL